jgi:hypothetical protein
MFLVWVALLSLTFFMYLYCLHPVVCHDLQCCGHRHNKYFKINQSGCLHWFYLITSKCFRPYFESPSGSFIKYISRYWNILIWIHIIVNHYNHHNTCHYYQNCKKIFKFLKILSSLCKILLFVTYCRWCLSTLKSGTGTTQKQMSTW